MLGRKIGGQRRERKNPARGRTLVAPCATSGTTCSAKKNRALGPQFSVRSPHGGVTTTCTRPGSEGENRPCLGLLKVAILGKWAFLTRKRAKPLLGRLKEAWNPRTTPPTHSPNQSDRHQVHCPAISWSIPSCFHATGIHLSVTSKDGSTRLVESGTPTDAFKASGTPAPAISTLKVRPAK